jgi:hypothetical protein
MESEELIMFKLLVALCLVVNFTSTAFASGTTKLVDYLISELRVTEILAMKGIKGQDAVLVNDYLSTALKALGAKKNVTPEELNNILDKLPIGSSDSKVKADLKALLSKPRNELSKDDVVQAINKLLYIADRHGKSIAITCANCVNESLALHGFDFSVKKIKGAKVKDIIENILPKDADEYHKFITTKARNAKMGDYSKPDVQVSPSEEKALATYFSILELGTPEQKKLALTIKKLSTKNGNTNLFDKVDSHKFWKIFTEEDDMSAKDLKGWTDTLNEVAERAEKENITVEQAFYKTLRKKAEGNEELTKQCDIIESKRCFFK